MPPWRGGKSLVTTRTVIAGSFLGQRWNRAAVLGGPGAAHRDPLRRGRVAGEHPVPPGARGEPRDVPDGEVVLHRDEVLRVVRQPERVVVSACLDLAAQQVLDRGRQ